MGQSRRVFTQKFKQAALKLVTIGRHPTAQVARDLGITLNLLRRWKQEIPAIPSLPSRARSGASLTKRSSPASRRSWPV